MGKANAFRKAAAAGSEPSETAPAEASAGANSMPVLMFQGWTGIAVWMAVGLLLEGLLGYKAPAYLLDQQRRELFRLAHSHGVLLNFLLVAAALSEAYLSPPRIANLCLMIGSVFMPLGFLLAGIWHPEGDPGLGIWMVPPGALLVIFGAVATAIVSLTRRPRQAPPSSAED